MLALSSERPQAVRHGLGVMALVQAMCMAPQERVCTCMYLAEVSGVGAMVCLLAWRMPPEGARPAGDLQVLGQLARCPRGSPGAWARMKVVGIGMDET